MVTKEFGENRVAAKALDARDFSGGILGKRNVVSYVHTKSLRWGLFHLLSLPHSLSLMVTVRNIASRLSWGFTLNFFFVPCMPLLSLPLIIISFHANCDLLSVCSVRKHCLFVRMLF